MVMPRRLADSERPEHLARDVGHTLNRSLEGGLVCLGWRPETADLANELQGGVVQLGVTRRVIRMAQTLNVAAHDSSVGSLIAVWCELASGQRGRSNDSPDCV
jgi:hypothetical protein